MIKEDGLRSAFLTEPSFEQWRKQASLSVEEESASKRVDRIEEMAIPSDLEDKLAYVVGTCTWILTANIYYDEQCGAEQDQLAH